MAVNIISIVWHKHWHYLSLSLCFCLCPTPISLHQLKVNIVGHFHHFFLVRNWRQKVATVEKKKSEKKMKRNRKTLTWCMNHRSTVFVRFTFTSARRGPCRALRVLQDVRLLSVNTMDPFYFLFYFIFLTFYLKKKNKKIKFYLIFINFFF